MAWAFLSGYFTGLKGKTISVVDYSCIGGGQAQVIIRNSGTSAIALSPPNCNVADTITGAASFTCGEMTITKTTGNLVTGELNTASIAQNTNVIFTETCGAGNTCIYRFVTSSAGIGPNPNTATITC
jgi:hypothetical protein